MNGRIRTCHMILILQGGVSLHLSVGSLAEVISGVFDETVDDRPSHVHHTGTLHYILEHVCSALERGSHISNGIHWQLEADDEMGIASGRLLLLPRPVDSTYYLY